MASKKQRFPKKLVVWNTIDRAEDQILLCAETPEEIGEEFDGDPVAVYELVAVGKFSVEKQIDAKLVKKS